MPSHVNRNMMLSKQHFIAQKKSGFKWAFWESKSPNQRFWTMASVDVVRSNNLSRRTLIWSTYISWFLQEHRTELLKSLDSWTVWTMIFQVFIDLWMLHPRLIISFHMLRKPLRRFEDYVAEGDDITVWVTSESNRKTSESNGKHQEYLNQKVCFVNVIFFSDFFWLVGDPFLKFGPADFF